MKDTQKTVLVTGGAGYIGAHVCKALAREGWRVVAYDHAARRPEALTKFATIVPGDLADAGRLKDVMAEHKPAGVIHLAASISVPESFAKPDLYYRNNVTGTLNVLEAMRATGVNKIVFSSTAAVYGLPENPLIDEDAPTRPINPYGSSKLMAEGIIRDMAAAHGFDVRIFRYFNASGCDPDSELGLLKDNPGNLIPLVLLCALGKRPHIEVFGTDYDTPDGTAIRDYIHVSDLATAHAAAIGQMDGRRMADLYNLGSGTGYSVLEVIETARRITGREIPVILRSRREGDPAKTIAVSDRAEAALGWRPSRGLDDMIGTLWKWYLKID